MITSWTRTYIEHLANGSNKSDWMHVYELAMNKKLNNWLTN